MTLPGVGIGSIRLYDEAVPTLSAGRYRFRSALEIDDRTHGSSLPAPAEGGSVFEVAAPRYVLDRSEVVSSNPPRSASGAFGDRLPHVALARRTLPWERRYADGTPWLALVVIRADEADMASSPLRAGLGATVVAAMDAADPVVGDPTVTLLKIKDAAVFRQVLPSRAEVGLLAHVRQVNVADGALAGSDDDGWFAVVTANRLPLADDEAVPYIACLVSLEERGDVWALSTGQPVPPLLVLHSWTFTSSGVGGTFEHLAAQMDLAAFGAPASGAPAVLNAEGAVSLERTLRDGSAASSTYRGPLVGLAPTGTPSGDGDVTLSAAWELGRLLATADGRFLREVVGWHRSAETAARTQIVHADLAEALAAMRPKGSAAPAAADGQTGTGAAMDSEPTGADGYGVSQLDGLSLAGAVLDSLRSVHNRPANLWQAHPAGTRIVTSPDRTVAPPASERHVPGTNDERH